VRESAYQRHVDERVRAMLPGCEIFKNDPMVTHQGIPDRLILWRGGWGMLEVKTSADAPSQENQPYWVEYYNNMSFASFIYPENEEQVLRDLQSALTSARETCLSKSK
jgi:hypothetical protein